MAGTVMSETPPAMPKAFGRYDWAAVFCLIAVPVMRLTISGMQIVSYMFPDSPAVYHVVLGLAPHLQGIVILGVVCGLVALMGMRQGKRVRICWMTAVGLLFASYQFFGWRLR